MITGRKINTDNRRFWGSKLTLDDFPESLREIAKEKYCSDKTALQAQRIYEYIRNTEPKNIEPHYVIANEDTLFDDSGTYYGYVLSCRMSKNKKLYCVRVLIEFDTIRKIYLKTDCLDPKSIEIAQKFGCSIPRCVGKFIKLNVNNSIYKGELRSFINEIEPVSAKEKEMIYFAANKLSSSLEMYD